MYPAILHPNQKWLYFRTPVKHPHTNALRNCKNFSSAQQSFHHNDISQLLYDVEEFSGYYTF